MILNKVYTFAVDKRFTAIYYSIGEDGRVIWNHRIYGKI